jgi:UPF0716 family protein affecting phage T7 exclusion
MFFAIPFFFLELYLSLKTGETIGFFASVVWIMLTALFGSVLLKNAPFAVMGNMMAVQKGKLDIKKFQDASMSYFVGAILLIVPGVLSDFFGLIALGYTLYLQFVAKITPQQTNFNQNKGDNDVIDVEIIDEHIDSNSNA